MLCNMVKHDLFGSVVLSPVLEQICDPLKLVPKVKAISNGNIVFTVPRSFSTWAFS
jgi:hypothetical protein